jgi:hypothetical protein
MFGELSYLLDNHDGQHYTVGMLGIKDRQEANSAVFLKLG